MAVRRGTNAALKAGVVFSVIGLLGMSKHLVKMIARWPGGRLRGTEIVFQFAPVSNRRAIYTSRRHLQSRELGG